MRLLDPLPCLPCGVGQAYGSSAQQTRGCPSRAAAEAAEERVGSQDPPVRSVSQKDLRLLGAGPG